MSVDPSPPHAAGTSEFLASMCRQGGSGARPTKPTPQPGACTPWDSKAFLQRPCCTPPDAGHSWGRRHPQIPKSVMCALLPSLKQQPSTWQGSPPQQGAVWDQAGGTFAGTSHPKSCPFPWGRAPSWHPGLLPGAKQGARRTAVRSTHLLPSHAAHPTGCISNPVMAHCTPQLADFKANRLLRNHQEVEIRANRQSL